MSSSISLTPSETHVLLHALGASNTRDRLGWRNRYAADPSNAEVNSLERKGLISLNRISPHGMRMMSVTDEGIDYVRSIGHEVEIR